MYRRVLVPLDGSKTALQVLPYAKLVAQSTGASITLLQALNEYPRELIARMGQDIAGEPGAYPPPSDAWTNLQESARSAASRTLEDQAGPLRAEGFSVDTKVVEEDPADAIVLEAENDPSSIIAICTHGRSGIGRWMVGSVTDKVIRQATNPVLVVRAREGQTAAAAPRIRRVLLPLDGTEKSSAASAHAVEMAKALGVGITVLRSISPMAYGDTFAEYVPSMYEDLASEIDSDVRDYLTHEARLLREQGVSDVIEKAQDGYPATVILEEVGEAGDVLVVMATHGRSGIGRWVLGSVSDRVVRHSPGPVLVVRPATS